MAAAAPRATPPRDPKGARAIEEALQAAERAEAALGSPRSGQAAAAAALEADAPLFVSRWSFRPTNANCLRLRPGDVVQVIDRSHAEWWYGITNGSAGYFPHNYVTPTKPRQESVTEPPASLIWSAESPAAASPAAAAAGTGMADDALMEALFNAP